MELIIIGGVALALLFGFGSRQLRKGGQVVDRLLNAANNLAALAEDSSATLREECSQKLAARRAKRKVD